MKKRKFFPVQATLNSSRIILSY